MAEVHHILKAPSPRVELGRWSLLGSVDSREWGGEFVVRADSTGATHLLSGLAGRTIGALREGPAHFEDIAARVFNDSAQRSAATAALIASFALIQGDTPGLQAALQELEDLGLVRVSLT